MTGHQNSIPTPPRHALIRAITVLTAFLLALSAPHTLQAAELVPLILTKAPVALTTFPLATGVPIPRGELWSATNARLISSTGVELPIQASALAKWPDGSIKSLLVRYRGALSDTLLQWWLLEYGPDVTPAAQEPDPLQISETAGRITVNTGPMELVIGKAPFRIFDQVKVRLDEGYEPMLSHPSDIIAVNAFDGKVYRASLYESPSVAVEEDGPMRAVIRASGWLRSDDGGWLAAYLVRIYAYSGQDYVKVECTLVDPRPEMDVQQKRAQLALSISAYGIELPYSLVNASYAFGGDEDSQQIYSGPVDPSQEYLLHQYGRFNYDVVSGTLLPFTFLYGGLGVGTGSKAAGWADVSAASHGMAVMVKHFWQQFPKELSVQGDKLLMHLHPWRSSWPQPDLAYPAFSADTGYLRPNTLYSPREGLAKTYELLFQFHAGDRASARPERLNRAFQADLLPITLPQWYAQSGVYGRIIETGPWSAGLDNYVMSQIYIPSVEEGGLLASMYGWRDFGDHLRTGFCDTTPLGLKVPCFYNDSHVGSHVYFQQYLRTLDPRWRDYAWNATRFFMDLGVSHTLQRYGYWKQGFGPGEAHLISHDVYDHVSRNLHWGHAHVSGVADLYLLTGDPTALAVLREVGDWWERAVPVFFPTPLPDPHYAEAERDFAWPLFTLVEIYRGTGDPKYLQAAGQIVRHLIEWWQRPADHLVNSVAVGRNDWQQGTGWWEMNPKCDNCSPGSNGTNPWFAGHLLSALIYFYEYDKDYDYADGALVKEMMLQTMNYVVKYGWNAQSQCFRYAETQTDSCGGFFDNFQMFPLAYLYRLYAAGGLEHPEWYDTAPWWIWIAYAKYQDWKQVKWRGSNSAGFYGYEIAFMPEFFREMREWELAVDSETISSIGRDINQSRR
jgi:hypothetical protein